MSQLVMEALVWVCERIFQGKGTALYICLCPTISLVTDMEVQKGTMDNGDRGSAGLHVRLAAVVRRARACYFGEADRNP